MTVEDFERRRLQRLDAKLEQQMERAEQLDEAVTALLSYYRDLDTLDTALVLASIAQRHVAPHHDTADEFYELLEEAVKDHAASEAVAP